MCVMCAPGLLFSQSEVLLLQVQLSSEDVQLSGVRVHVNETGTVCNG